MTVRLLVEAKDSANLQKLQRMLQRARYRTQPYPSERHNQQSDATANGFERPVLAFRAGVDNTKAHAQQDHNERAKLIALTQSRNATLTPRQHCTWADIEPAVPKTRRNSSRPPKGRILAR